MHQHNVLPIPAKAKIRVACKQIATRKLVVGFRQFDLVVVLGLKTRIVLKPLTSENSTYVIYSHAEIYSTICLNFIVNAC